MKKFLVVLSTLAFALLGFTATASAADIAAPPVPASTPNGSRVVQAPTCSRQSLAGGAKASICLTVPTTDMSGPASVQSVVKLSGINGSVLAANICLRSVNYTSGIQEAAPQCVKHTWTRPKSGRKVYNVHFEMNEDIGTGFQASVQFKSGHQPLKAVKWPASPIVALPSNVQLPPLVCDHGRGDTPLTAITGYAIGMSSVCVNGDASTGSILGRTAVSLPAGDWYLRNCVRVSDRGDYCTDNISVHLDAPGYAWMYSNPPVGYALLPGDTTSEAATYASVENAAEDSSDYAVTSAYSFINLATGLPASDY